jgi:cytoskeletal protein RodZ
MPNARITRLCAVAALSIGLGLPGIALAYDEDDAIRDCNQRLRSEYKLTDFRSESAKQLPGEGHRYEVSGKTKVDGTKYDYRCDIKDRHVTAIHYDGPEPEGMDTAEKVAIGAAAAVATAIAVDAMTKDKDEAAEAAPTAPEPTVRTNADGSMEVSVSADCTVQFNDIGMRDGHSGACTTEELTAANKAVTKHLSAARANQ